MARHREAGYKAGCSGCWLLTHLIDLEALAMYLSLHIGHMNTPYSPPGPRPVPQF